MLGVNWVIQAEQQANGLSTDAVRVQESALESVYFLVRDNYGPWRTLFRGPRVSELRDAFSGKNVFHKQRVTNVVYISRNPNYWREKWILFEIILPRYKSLSMKNFLTF